MVKKGCVPLSSFKDTDDFILASYLLDLRYKCLNGVNKVLNSVIKTKRGHF